MWCAHADCRQRVDVDLQEKVLHDENLDEAIDFLNIFLMYMT